MTAPAFFGHFCIIYVFDDNTYKKNRLTRQENSEYDFQCLGQHLLFHDSI